ncbi:hypothetical protein [Stenotrophomonas sp. PS02297]|uniref:hypothetical protein n=1 Tax=Stenotrophomonas sp. PS02297 TaxID=2991423 RepID=UPI00249C44AA|nr:hypothetical protein [Stenotrophomonas sp. PS02297]
MIRSPSSWPAGLLAAITPGLPAPPSRIGGPASSLTLAPPAMATNLPQRSSHADLMRVPGPVRQFSAASLSNNPVLSTGTTKMDFRPMLENPQALPNIALTLQGLPDLVEVRQQALETTQAMQGMLLRNQLSYRLGPAACSDAPRCARVAAAGSNCLGAQAISRANTEESPRSSPARSAAHSVPASTA